MLGVIGRRSVEASISLFAVLGFCYVPLGSHTGLEHAKAIFATKPARRAARELSAALGSLEAKLLAQIREFAKGELGARELGPPEPSNSAGNLTASDHFRRHREPKPQIPRL